MYDLLIKGGLIVDGSGKPPYIADVAVQSNEISLISKCIAQPAVRVVDASGLIVSPGFIDVHTHDDLVLFSDPYNIPKLLQGVTTVVVGNCGFGVCPYSNDTISSLVDYAQPVLGNVSPEQVFSNFESYAKALDDLEKGLNIAALLAHGAVYIAENGFSNSPMDNTQIASAQSQVQNAMEHGAVGLSAGFMYAPGCYCDTASMRPLTDIVAEYNGLYCVHLRSESEFIREAIDEVVDIVKNSRTAAHISHFKNVGKQYRGNIKHLVAQIEQSITNGVDLSYDMYPYTAGSTTMSILFPNYALTRGVNGCLQLLQDHNMRRHLEDELRHMWKGEDNLSLLCGWENVIISSLHTEANSEFIGKSVADIAAIQNISPETACTKLFMKERGKITILLNHIDKQDMHTVISSKPCIVASDGIPVGEMPHPRLYGTFPAFIRTFVRENRLLSIEAAIEKITSMPAKRFGLGKRGYLCKGYAADIVVFDPDAIADRATYSNPLKPAKGISHVIVSGIIVSENGTITGKKPGKFIHHEQ